MIKKRLIITNIAVIALILGAIGYFVYDQLRSESSTSTEYTASQEELDAMQQAIETSPVIGETDLNDEQIANELEHFDKAIERLRLVDFDTGQGLNEVAQIKRRLGDFDGAIATWEYMNIIRPLNSLSFSNLAALYHYELREFEKAEENYRISVDNDPDDFPTIRNFYELYFYDFEDYAKAEALLLEAIANNPGAADMYSLLGRLYADIGEIEKAIDYYEQHLELAPQNDAARLEIERLQSLLAE